MSTEPELANTRAACYMILIKDNKIPLVFRSNTGYRDNEWALPSGKLDLGETFTEGSIRELKEEIGVDAETKDIEHAITSHRKSDNDPRQAWVDIYFVCNKWQGEPSNTEPHKHSELKWFDLDNLPEDMMGYQKQALEEWKQGKKYTEFDW